MRTYFIISRTKGENNICSAKVVDIFNTYEEALNMLGKIALRLGTEIKIDMEEMQKYSIDLQSCIHIDINGWRYSVYPETPDPFPDGFYCSLIPGFETWCGRKLGEVPTFGE